MNVLAKLISQAKEPKGIIGSYTARFMNIGHNKLTNWALSYLNINEDDIILDIGCGGGKTVNKLAKIAIKGKVYGIDFSEASVKLSSKINKNYINNRKVDIQKASVSKLPFADNYFNIITAIETYFFWPDLGNDMKEILRVLKPKGILLIVSEVYKNSENEKSLNRWSKFSNTTDFMRYQTKEEFKQTFKNAGYQDVNISDNVKYGWICGIGTKS